MKVHLVDGTFELFRTYYGAPEASDAEGRPVGAVRGLLATLGALLSRPEVTHVACAFDHVIESFRNDLFAGYKTGEGIDPALYRQFPLAETASRALGIVTWPMVEFEADDALATAAARFVGDPRVEEVVLCTPDKDLAQCVRGDRVVLWDRLRDTRLDAPGVSAKFGVPPALIPDYLALVGDSADGIPGVPRWGKKSAATLLAHFGGLEAIPRDGCGWPAGVRGAAALAASLAEHWEVVPLYKRLATLRTDVPLTESLDDLEWRGARGAELDSLTREIGDSAVLRRISRFA